ncbi:MAG: hypothetical protein V1858_02805 [Candidatus Gottesmanbacteria bacterium]
MAINPETLEQLGLTPEIMTDIYLARSVLVPDPCNRSSLILDQFALIEHVMVSKAIIEILNSSGYENFPDRADFLKRETSLIDAVSRLIPKYGLKPDYLEKIKPDQICRAGVFLYIANNQK